ncbi:PHO85 cyclin-5 [Coemansia sp. RSA 2322]|nr:PHO85 cyclin-5 [Coemansia sp. RSA 2322]
MVSSAGSFTIASSTRLHRLEAAAPGASSALAPASRGDPALHVGGWYQQQQNAPKPTALSASYASEPVALTRVYEYSALPQQRPSYSTEASTAASSAAVAGGLKRALAPSSANSSPAAVDALEHSAHKRLCDAQRQPPAHSAGLRITDLLNPAAAVVAAAADAAPALAAAHRMTVPPALARSSSADAEHYHRQLAHLQQRVQQQQLRAAAAPAPAPADPTSRFARTATAPAGTAACAQNIVQEALTLDKVYDIACVIIENIWPNHSNSQRTQLCSLRCFVAETHRQSRLGPDALELCMFYLLRAKSIIQAKERAARQKEEEELQHQQQLHELYQQQQQQQQQQHRLYHQQRTFTEGTTPPLSPNHVVTTQCNAAGVDSMIASSPLDNIKSPITPTDSAPTAQAVYVPMDKQQLLVNSMITPLTPVGKRLLAGSAGSLPNSYRSFVVPAKDTDSSNNPQPEQYQRGWNSKEQKLSSSSPAQEAAMAAANTAGNAAAKPKPKPDVTKCGRRMFVAALISASKFMYDRTYSNKAWNKITKLPLAQLSDMERAFLDMIDYRLYVDSPTYDKFHRLLARSAMRNGRLMVCDPLSATSNAAAAAAASPVGAGPMTPLSPPSPGGSGNPAKFTFVAPTPASQAAASCGSLTPAPLPSAYGADLRSSMNMPVSAFGTPVIQTRRGAQHQQQHHQLLQQLPSPLTEQQNPQQQHAAAATTMAAAQMQEQVINLLRAQQLKQHAAVISASSNANGSSYYYYNGHQRGLGGGSSAVSSGVVSIGE